MTKPEATTRSTTARRAHSGALIGGVVSPTTLVIGLLVFLVTALLAVCMLALVWGFILGPASDYPSDEELIARYMANKAKFEQLADMMIAEQEIAWVLNGNCELKDRSLVTGDENERCRAYLELCHDLEIELIAIGEEPFTLYVGSSGGAMGGSALGYQYTSDPPSSGLVEDTRRRGDGWAGGTAYHHIEGNWYIFLWDG